MTRRSAERASRALVIIAFASAAWAMAVAVTGGVGIESGPIRLTSRTPRNPAIIAALSAVLAWALATPARRRHWVSRAQNACAAILRAVNALPPRLAPVLAAGVAGAVMIVALQKGTHVAGGADSYGYASQADLWAHATLRVEQPLMDQLPWPAAREALAPLGYRPAVRGSAIVPVYGPGLPMVMAVFERAAGRSAVFLAVPAMGALAVWATYLMGCRLAGRTVGVAGAVLLATSPVFLYQVVQPMSDVPAAAWWALTLALLAGERRGAALGAGVSAGLALLTRANLAPLFVVIGAYLAQAIRTDRSLAGRAAQRTILFAVGAIPGCLAVLALNTLWYGSPLDNGYGRFNYLYEASNVWPNLARYPRWLLDSQTPIVLLAFAAPALLRPKPGATDAAASSTVVASGFSLTQAWMWLAFSVSVLACYVFYAPFDVWWYLRFLLPAFPPMSVLTAAAIVAASGRLAGRARRLASAAVISAVAWHGVAYARDRSAFDLRDGELKYVAVGEYIARRLPEQAVLLSIQHSGSARYYSGRLTIRYDWIDPHALDAALDDLARLGYRAYFLLQDDEEPHFRARFAEHSRLGRLDWPPIARLRRSPGVKIYDPAGRGPASTDIIDDPGGGARPPTAAP